MQARLNKRQIVTVYGIGLLGVMGGWMGVAAIAPPPVHAYVSRVDVVVAVQPGETYETFLNRAEAVARAATQRAFDRDILTSEVYVIIVGRKPDATVQVLSVQVSRNQWRSRPDSRRWATYYSSARVLLGFGSSAPARSPAAASPTPPGANPAAIPVPILEPQTPAEPLPQTAPPTQPPLPATAPANAPSPTQPRSTPQPPTR